MRAELRYTLLSDGSSDAALMPILDWLLIENGVSEPIQKQWADLRRLRQPPKELSERIRVALEFYPCDLLFIHRDAEKLSYVERAGEIRTALAKIVEDHPPPHVYVIPVRMTEAWLLFDESAIRFAAGNRSGQNALHLPDVNTLESLPDPKADLYSLIREASNLQGRRLKRLNPGERVQRITTHVNNFAPLRALDAFRNLEADIAEFVRVYVSKNQEG